MPLNLAVSLLAGAVFAVIGVRLGILLRDRREAVAVKHERQLGSWSAPVRHAVVEIAVAESVEIPPPAADPGPVRHSVSGTGGHRGKRKRGKRR